MELVFEHDRIEPLVVQKLGMRATLLVFPQDIDVKRICTTLQSVEIWLGHSVAAMHDIATPEQLSMAVIKAGGER